MSDTAALTAIADLLQVCETQRQSIDILHRRVKALERRDNELSEDVAGLANHLATLVAREHPGHSIRVMPAAFNVASAAEVAELRAELAAEVAAMTERIDHVHSRALKALTDLTEKRTPA